MIIIIINIYNTVAQQVTFVRFYAAHMIIYTKTHKAHPVRDEIPYTGTKSLPSELLQAYLHEDDGHGYP